MSTLCEYYNAGDDDYDSLYAPRRQIQSFLAASTHVLASVKVKLYKSGTPSGTLTVGVYAADASWHSTGSALDSGTIDLSSLTTDTNGAWYEVTMTQGVSLSSGTRYTIQITSSSSDTTNKGNWRCDSSSPTYADGIWSRSDDGSTWTDSSSRDRMFEVYGPGNSVTLGASKDTDIRQNAPTTNYGSETYVEILATASSKHKILLAFDCSWNIPLGATITSAELRLHCTAGTSGRTVTCYRLLRTDWVETEATWNVYKTGSSWGTAGAGSSSTDYTTTDAATHSTQTSYDYTATWNVTAQVQTAIDSTGRIAYFLLVDEGADASIWQDYDSKNGTGTAPALYVTWTEAVSVTTINIGDTWKTINWTGSKINIGDTWKTIAAVFVNVGDAWKAVYETTVVTGDFLLLETGSKILQETNDKIKLESSS